MAIFIQSQVEIYCRRSKKLAKQDFQKTPLLMEADLTGDYAALFEMYQAELIRYLYGMVREREVAADLTQDTFARGYRLWLEMPGREGWRPLLYKIATNCALDFLRRRRRFLFLSFGGGKSKAEQAETMPEDTPFTQSADPTGKVLTRLAVLDTLREMDKDAVACLLLYYDQGFSCGEIAAITGASQQVVWKRLSRARQHFFNLYRKEQASDV